MPPSRNTLMPRSHSMSLCWCSGLAAASRIAASALSSGACASTPKAMIRAARQRVLREQCAIQFETVLIRIGIDDAREADRVVVREQLAEPAETIRFRWLRAAGIRLDVAAAVAQDSGRLPLADPVRRGRADPPAPETSRRCRSWTAPSNSVRHPARCERPQDVVVRPHRARRGLDSAAREAA